MNLRVGVVAGQPADAESGDLRADRPQQAQVGPFQFGRVRVQVSSGVRLS
jgi:hypothetical protein